MQRPPWFDFDRLHGRLFEKGDLKYVILQLLSERPAHGYEVIRALEERFRRHVHAERRRRLPNPPDARRHGVRVVRRSRTARGSTQSPTTDGASSRSKGRSSTASRQRTSSWWNPTREDRTARHEARVARLRADAAAARKALRGPGDDSPDTRGDQVAPAGRSTRSCASRSRPRRRRARPRRVTRYNRFDALD